MKELERFRKYLQMQQMACAVMEEQLPAATPLLSVHSPFITQVPRSRLLPTQMSLEKRPIV